MTSLQKLLEDNRLETRGYSGRGMYGKSCLGVDCKLGELLEAIAHAGLMAEAIAEMARSVQTDSMGRGTIFYWPSVPYDEDAGFTAEEVAENYARWSNMRKDDV